MNYSGSLENSLIKLWFSDVDNDSISSLGSTDSFQDDSDNSSIPSEPSLSSAEEEQKPVRRHRRCYSHGQVKRWRQQQRQQQRTSRQERILLAKKQNPKNLSRHHSSPASPTESPSSKEPQRRVPRRQRRGSIASSVSIELLWDDTPEQPILLRDRGEQRWDDSLSKLHSSMHSRGSKSRWSEGTCKTFTSSQIDQFSMIPKVPQRQKAMENRPMPPQRQKTGETSHKKEEEGDQATKKDLSPTRTKMPPKRPQLPNRQKSFRAKNHYAKMAAFALVPDTHRSSAPSLSHLAAISFAGNNVDSNGRRAMFPGVGRQKSEPNLKATAVNSPKLPKRRRSHNKDNDNDYQSNGGGSNSNSTSDSKTDEEEECGCLNLRGCGFQTPLSRKSQSARDLFDSRTSSMISTCCMGEQ